MAAALALLREFCRKGSLEGAHLLLLPLLPPSRKPPIPHLSKMQLRPQGDPPLPTAAQGKAELQQLPCPRSAFSGISTLSLHLCTAPGHGRAGQANSCVPLLLAPPQSLYLAPLPHSLHGHARNADPSTAHPAGHVDNGRKPQGRLPLGHEHTPLAPRTTSTQAGLCALGVRRACLRVPRTMLRSKKKKKKKMLNSECGSRRRGCRWWPRKAPVRRWELC